MAINHGTKYIYIDYMYDDSVINQRILDLAHKISQQQTVRKKQIQQKNNFHFLIYNDSIAVVVKQQSNVSTFIIDTFNDYELILGFVDTNP